MSATTTTLDKITKGEKPATAVQKLSSFLDKLKPQIALALPRHLTADRMSRLALTAFSTTPALQKCTPQSIAGCIMVAAQLGLEPGVNGQAYLIAYGDKCTFVPGWRGLVDLVARSGRATVWTGAVFEGDQFEYQLGDAPHCRHTPSDRADDAEFTHVYAIGRVKDSQMPVIEVWSRSKVARHLEQYNKVGKKHYAHANENNYQMYGRKVALLQVLKYMPSSIELSTAVELSHAADTGGYVIEGAVSDMSGVDQETGEILKPSATFDLAEAAEMMKACSSRETLAELRDELRSAPQAVQQQLDEAFARRDAELGDA